VFMVETLHGFKDEDRRGICPKLSQRNADEKDRDDGTGTKDRPDFTDEDGRRRIPSTLRGRKSTARS